MWCCNMVSRLTGFGWTYVWVGFSGCGLCSGGGLILVVWLV